MIASTRGNTAIWFHDEHSAFSDIANACDGSFRFHQYAIGNNKFVSLNRNSILCEHSISIQRCPCPVSMRATMPFLFC